MDAQFYVVRKMDTSTLAQMAQRLYPGSSVGQDDFRRLNQGAVADGQRLQAGQILFLPALQCYGQEEEIIEAIAEMNQLLLRDMDWAEREQWAQHTQLINHAAQEHSWAKVMRLTNSVAGGALGSLSLHTRQMSDLLREFEQRYAKTVQLHGRLTPEFYAYRGRVYRALDDQLIRLARKISLGIPLDMPASRGLKVNNRSQILAWKRQGNSGRLKDFMPHFKNMQRVNKYLRRGGYLTIGIDGLLTADVIKNACQSSDPAHCQRTALVESGGFVGGTLGGVGGGTAAYLTCNAVFAFESLGTSFLWCGLVAGAVGGYAGGKGLGWGVGKLSEKLADKLITKTIVSP